MLATIVWCDPAARYQGNSKGGQNPALEVTQQGRVCYLRSSLVDVDALRRTPAFGGVLSLNELDLGYRLVVEVG